MQSTNLTLSANTPTLLALRPLSLSKALLHFFLVGAFFRLSLYTLLPFLLGQGLSHYEAYIVSLTVPSAVLFALAFATAKYEGLPESDKALAGRLRLRRPGVGVSEAHLDELACGRTDTGSGQTRGSVPTGRYYKPD